MKKILTNFALELPDTDLWMITLEKFIANSLRTHVFDSWQRKLLQQICELAEPIVSLLLWVIYIAFCKIFKTNFVVQPLTIFHSLQLNMALVFLE